MEIGLDGTMPHAPRVVGADNGVNKRADASQTSPTSPHWTVFICYRQVDGRKSAEWLKSTLHDRQLDGFAGDDGQVPTLKVYLDVTVPAVADWQAIHGPSLETSRAMLVVCTPGLYSNLGPNDWVHRELNWWLSNRTAPPILIDATGEGSRWIPAAIKERWPNAQYIEVRPTVWTALPAAERAAHESSTIMRIIGGITASEAKVRFEDLERQRSLNHKLKISLVASLALLLVAGIAAGTSVWFAYLANQREQMVKQQLALTLIQQAENASAVSDDLGTDILAAKALAMDQSPTIRQRSLPLTLLTQGRLDEAFNALTQVLDARFDTLEKTLPLASRVDRISETAALRPMFETWLRLSAELRTQAYDRVNRFKRFVTGAPTAHRLLISTGTAQASKVLSDLREAEAELAHLAYTVPYRDFVAGVNVGSYSATTSSIAKAYSAARELTANGDIDFNIDGVAPWQAVQERLRPDEVLVEYLRYRDRYTAWVVLADRPPIRVELEHSDDIDRKVEEYRNAIARDLDFPEGSQSESLRGISLYPQPDPSTIPQPDPDTTPDVHRFRSEMRLSHVERAGNELKELIWQPIVGELPSGVTAVYVAPDSALATIPFAALPSAEPGRNLLDDYTFIYLVSGSVLARPQLPNLGEGQVLLVGGVEYGEIGVLPYLPGTADEVRIIAELFAEHAAGAETKILSSSQASEQAVRREVEKSLVIHLATHGWAGIDQMLGFAQALQSEQRSEDERAEIVRGLLPGGNDNNGGIVDQLPGRPEPDDNAVAIGIEPLHIDPEVYLVSRDPALQSGLHFAAEDFRRARGVDDGILTAMEVAGLNLHGADMAVLSSCDTVGTPSSGRGVIGLVKSFHEAGVDTVVASLYPVADELTVKLMSGFYRSMLAGVDPASALQSAAKRLRDDGYGSYFWAPFVIYASK